VTDKSDDFKHGENSALKFARGIVHAAIEKAQHQQSANHEKWRDVPQFIEREILIKLQHNDPPMVNLKSAFPKPVPMELWVCGNCRHTNSGRSLCSGCGADRYKT
jgi:hypothetical protein